MTFGTDSSVELKQPLIVTVKNCSIKGHFASASYAESESISVV